MLGNIHSLHHYKPIHLLKVPVLELDPFTFVTLLAQCRTATVFEYFSTNKQFYTWKCSIYVSFCLHSPSAIIYPDNRTFCPGIICIKISLYCIQLFSSSNIYSSAFLFVKYVSKKWSAVGYGSICYWKNNTQIYEIIKINSFFCFIWMPATRLHVVLRRDKYNQIHNTFPDWNEKMSVHVYWNGIIPRIKK